MKNTKKLLIMLIALLLCVSVIFVGCTEDDVTDGNTPADSTDNGGGDNDGDDNKDNEGGSSSAMEIAKDTVIKSFNRFSLYSIYNSIVGGLEDAMGGVSFEDVKIFDVDQQIEGSLNADGEEVSLLLAIKDGLLYSHLGMTESGVVYGEEQFTYITESLETINFFLGTDGKWAPEIFDEDLDADVSWPDASDDGFLSESDDIEGGAQMDILGLLESFDAEMLTRITFVAPDAEQLIEKDGKLVLDNSYWADLIAMNRSAFNEIIGDDITDEEWQEFSAKLDAALEKIGFELAFRANQEAITAIYISSVPAADAEAPYKRMFIEIEKSEDGALLKSIKFSLIMVSDYDRIEFEEGISLTLATVISDNKITGAAIAAKINMISYEDLTFDYDDNSTTSEFVALCQSLTATITATSTPKNDSPAVRMAAKMTTEKAYSVKEISNFITGESNVSVTAKDKTGLGQELDAEITISPNGEDGVIDIGATMSVGEQSISVTAKWHTESAPDFPEVPSEIADYIAGLTAV